jgi:hypothetical protein
MAIEAALRGSISSPFPIFSVRVLEREERKLNNSVSEMKRTGCDRFDLPVVGVNGEFQVHYFAFQLQRLE